MYENLYTTEEVATMEGVTVPIAQRWAKKYKVRTVGKYYFWNEVDVLAFKNRKKTPGPNKKGSN